MNIPDTACNQTTVQFSNSPNICFCTYGKQTRQDMCWNKQKTWKNIPDIIDRSLKKDKQILIIFGRNISDMTGY